MIPSTLLSSLLLLASSVPTLAQDQTQTNDETPSNCTIFNWDHHDAYLREYPPLRVSAAKTCPDSNSNSNSNSNLTCAITAAGDELFTAVKNVTSLPDRYWPNMVLAAVDNATFPAPGFNDSIVLSIDQTLVLQPGESGYVNLTALMFCYTGTMSNCTGALEDGTAVEFCAPVWQNRYSVSGAWEVVNISKSDVGKYKDPYENQVSGVEESAASRMERAGWVAVVLGVGMGAILL